VFDPALRERHIGDLQGMTLEAAAKDRREAYKVFLCHKRNQQIPVSSLVFYYHGQIFCLDIHSSIYE
jgi:broad specificity phosphatase PhoE